ncbi:ABC transporter ATP-binding protein [Actinomadura monticuli]|uniref:ABC transporter ATP-binding protein n=1 Tax=Actinomadura monticuli TaxID=3097367 RepID=A0ABV4Q606_9ACTN
MGVAIATDGLRRGYRRKRGAGEVLALDDFSIEIGEREIHGLLGPNGAGKSTLVKILSTVLLPTAGRAAVLGHDVVAETAKVRRDIGLVLGGDRGFYDRISARRNLAFWGALYRMNGREVRRRSADVLERVGLAEVADRNVESFSRGMKQRLHLARGLLHSPAVLFLDEPTAGLDPVAASAFRRLVLDTRAEGRTLLLATHDMDEAAALCDRVTLIDRGKRLLTAATAEVGDLLGNDEYVVFAHPDDRLAAALAGLPCVLAVTESNGNRHVHVGDSAGTATVLRWLLDHGVLDARRSRPTLEEVYMRTIGDRGMRV